MAVTDINISPSAGNAPQAILCTVCGGDPRRALHCKACGGAGIGIPSPDGFLVWDEPVDDFSIAFRKIRRSVNTFVNFSVMVVGIGCLVLFGYGVSQMDRLATLETFDFWISGGWEVTVFWLGLLIGCFLIFRLSEYMHEERLMPNWKVPTAEMDAHDKAAGARTQYRFSIGPFFSGPARDIVENAYIIAKSLHRTEITPAALFAAALASPSGGIFMVRLGMPFDRVKGPMARVLTAETGGAPPITLSRDAKRVLGLAYLDARATHRKHVDAMDLFVESFKASPKLQDTFDQLGFPPTHVLRVGEWIRLRNQLREDHERFVALAALKPKNTMNRAMTARVTPLLDRFSEDLTLAARNGFLSPIIGRTREMGELMRAIEGGRLAVALVGPNGAGKSAMVEQLARLMVEEAVPPILFDKRLVSVSLPQVIAAGDPGLAAERFLALLHEAGQSGNIVLVLNGVEALTGGSSGPFDLAEMLATELDKRYLLAIVTTTPDAWTSYLERRNLASKLAKVDVPALGVEETLSVLMARSGTIEYQNEVYFSYAALEQAANLSSRYLHEKAEPEQALDVLREAAVLARKERGTKTFVTGEDVASVMHDKTNIPVEAVTQSESKKLLDMEAHLHERVIGQDQAVTAVAQALRRARAELREGKRPIANFLFLGPTGVGKTELAKALAAEYFGNEEAMVRLDMSEYQASNSVSRMIGAPGDARGGLLTEAIRKTPFTVLLLDELEKAHPDILNLFLQVMDDGRLTDGVGRTVDFTNVLLIATSNAGASYIQSEIGRGTSIERITTGLLEQELKRVYHPEFLNRFDGVIVFKPLTMDDVVQIAWLMINGIAKRLERQKGVTFHADDAAVEELAKAGFDPQFGARPLRRVIQDRVDNALADLILRNEVGRKDTIVLEPGGTLRVEKAPDV